MTELRSATELWDENKLIFTDSNDEQYYILYQSAFYKALDAHTSDIRKVIEEKIEEIRKLKNDTPKDNILYKEKMHIGTYGILLLTEILEILKEKV